MTAHTGKSCPKSHAAPTAGRVRMACEDPSVPPDMGREQGAVGSTDG